MLAVTPLDTMIDGQGRPYFLWDCDLTLAQFRTALDSADETVQAYMVGKLMRQAKPDDVFVFVRARTIRRLWPKLLPHLGHTRPFWTWIFEQWEASGRGWQ
jgi:hypothetical protein